MKTGVKTQIDYVTLHGLYVMVTDFIIINADGPHYLLENTGGALGLTYPFILLMVSSDAISFRSPRDNATLLCLMFPELAF